jgi:hypothetical protein
MTVSVTSAERTSEDSHRGQQTARVYMGFHHDNLPGLNAAIRNRDNRTGLDLSILAIIDELGVT